MITTINGHKIKPRLFDCRFLCVLSFYRPVRLTWIRFAKEVIERNSFQSINFTRLVFILSTRTVCICLPLIHHAKSAYAYINWKPLSEQATKKKRFSAHRANGWLRISKSNKTFWAREEKMRCSGNLLM